ncbi:MAG TPA: 3'-5' exonuclease, partial [Solirubrobacterales bacterium]|nr:3'-5' exonuclease [Solirubrobacterales bacterium]
APFLPLADLIDATVAETGYDLAVLMRPAGEARFANLRKLMRLAAEYEAGEGRDLRGLLDFLAARAEADGDAQAATAIEGHDGVRIMTIHSAKGLEFGVVAVPQLSRSLLAGSHTPLLTLGHEADEPRVGMQLRRLGAPSLNLFAHRELREEGQRRDAEEELRLFHVAATRARDRLILSGVVRPEAAREVSTGTAVVERIVEAFGIDRGEDSSVQIPPPRARDGLDESFPMSELAVRVSHASAGQAALLARVHREGAAALDLGMGPAPLLEPHRPTAPRRPLSYTAITAHDEDSVRGLSGTGGQTANAEDEEAAELAREDGTARGRAVHGLLEWSANRGWLEPPEEVTSRFAAAEGLGTDRGGIESLLDPLRAWLGCDLFADRVRGADRGRAEVSILTPLAGTLIRGSIDLLVEHEGSPPLIVDYKTDRLGDQSPGERASHYEVQRDIYALAVRDALRCQEVDVAYVFLEQPANPVLTRLGPEQIDAAQARLVEEVERLHSGPVD